MALDVKRLNARYQQLRTERTGWDLAWKDLAELFLPTHWRSDTDTTAHKTPRINSRLVNSVGILAMRTLAAGMQGGMTSPVRPWFKLTLSGVADKDVPSDVGSWLEEVTNRMSILFHQSSFYTAVHGLYADLGTFGTALMVETADADGLNFFLCRPGEFVIDTNSKGEVDTFFRRLHMTAKQIVDQFGYSKAPKFIQEMMSNKNVGQQDERFNVIHGVFPRKDWTPGAKLSPEGKPYVSVYWIDDGIAGGSSTGARTAILDEGGYDIFPGFAPRWDVSGADVYGRSPAMEVVADCRMLQNMTATLLKMEHKVADPPLMADATVKAEGVADTPGSVNYLDMRGISGGRPLIAPVHQPDAQAIQAALEGIQTVEKRVQDGLYTDMFRLMIDDNRQGITATEVQARQQEKMVLVGPVVERLQKEFLQPLIVRTYKLMLEYGAIPQPPDSIQQLTGIDVDIQFESVLAQAQKLTATSSIDQSIAFVGQLAQVAPDGLDIIDMDSTIRNYLDRMGFPLSCLRSQDQIDALRQQRQQQQQMMEQQQMMAQGSQNAETISSAAANLSKAQVDADGQNALTAILGSMGGAAM